MPHNRAQWVTHTIDGGWATDFGNTVYASPQDGELRIPWLSKAENIKFTTSGAIEKYPGAYRIYDNPITSPVAPNGFTESSNITSVYEYSRAVGSIFTAKSLVAVCGGILYDLSTLVPAQVGGIDRRASTPVHMKTFADLLIIGTGGSPSSWDGTTLQSLAGSPPTFLVSESHAGRHWVAGDDTNPSRLYYSVAGNPEDWVGVGSGSIDIDPGDGDSILGLLSWKKELWVFKGGSRGSIHRITGTSTADFSRTIFITGLPLAGPHAIFPVGDDFAFWTSRGTCHSLTTTANYGDYVQTYVNYPILSWCRNPANITGGVTSSVFWQASTDQSQNITYTILNNSRVPRTTKSLLLMMDWRFVTSDNPYPRFSTLPLLNAQSVCQSAAAFDQNQKTPTFGTNEGFIYSELTEAAKNYGIRASSLTDYSYYESSISTPTLTYGPQVYQKTIQGIGVDLEISQSESGFYNQGNLVTRVGGRKAPTHTTTFTYSGFTPLGTFMLNVDQLAVPQDSSSYDESVGLESNALTYQFTIPKDVLQFGIGQNVVLKHFHALLGPSAESLENV